MNLKISPTERLDGEVKIPTSKSYTIRALLSASLCENDVLVRDPLISRDTTACMNVCESLGAVLKLTGDDVVVSGTDGTPIPQRDLVDCMNSGTTLRLATAISSLSRKPISFTGDASLRSRPIQPLLDALKHLGVYGESVNGFPPVKVRGPLFGGDVEISGNLSSQFISGLLMACPLATIDSTITITTELKSRPYIDLTLEVLEKFGVEIINNSYESFNIESNQKYSAKEYQVEGDFSSGAFIISAAALSQGDVKVQNLNPDSIQADKKIIEILQSMGAHIDIHADFLKIKGGKPLTGCVIDLSDSPDLLPIVSVLGVLAEGQTEIINTDHARVKECDRITAMATELKKLGGKVTERPDGLILKKSSLKGSNVDGWLDHRIIMSLAVAGLNAYGETNISGAQHIDVTYPGFIKDLRNLGGELYED